MKFRKLVVVMFAFFFVIGLALQTAEYDPVDATEQNISILDEKSITAAIVVTNDGMFTGAGFTGTGTEGDPYILDGVTVTTAVGNAGIYLSSTSAHFIIQNCVIDLTSAGGSYGIFLQYLGNGTIYNCTILGVTAYGIYSYESENLNFTENTISDCGDSGIRQYLTNQTEIINNTITDIVYMGIELNTCPNVTISGNTIMRINEAAGHYSAMGIKTQVSDNLTITYNEIRSVTNGRGISCQNEENVMISNNLIWKAWSDGIFVYDIPSVEISYNNISCIDYNGLEMSLLDSPYVVGNRIYRGIQSNSRGVSLSSVTNGTFEYNDIFKFVQYGIYALDTCSNNLFYENNLGWPGFSNARDDRSAAITNNWTSNQYSDYASGNYTIQGDAGVNDTSASLLSDSTAPTIDSPADIVINDTDINKWVTWHPYDRFPNEYLRYINYSGVQSFTWCNSSISISLDDLAPGVYDISITAYDCSNVGSTQDNVRITVLDTQPPVFTSFPEDYTIEYGERVWVNFTATDDTPNLMNVYIDEAGPYGNSPWTSPLALDWDNAMPGVGEHNYTAVLTDKAGNIAIETCLVTVEDTTTPTAPDFPSDFEVEAGDMSWVNFTLYDLSPNQWEIWLDDEVDVIGTFTDGEYESYMLNYATPGTHNITLVAWDDYDNTMIATCIVTYEDTTGPAITGDDDSSAEAGSDPNISWTWDELNPDNYSVYVNGSLITYSPSVPSTINFLLEEAPGIWNVTLVIYDESGNFETDEVWVTLVDTTAPTLVGFTDLSVELGEWLQVNWIVNDIDAWDQDGVWQVYVNGSEESSGIWNSSLVTYAMGPSVGIYNVTAVVTDAYGNSVTYTTWVTCEDTTAPTISGVTDQEIVAGTSILLNWTCSDFDPESLVLMQNGTVIVDQEWGGNDFSTLVGGLSAGVYNYTLVVTDASGHVGVDTVILIVTAATTTDTGTTDSTTPPPDDGGMMLILAIAGAGGAIVVVIIILFLKSKK